MAYTLDYNNNGFILTHHGPVTLGEIHEVNGLIHGHEGFDAHKFQLIDLLDADFSQLDEATAKEPGATDFAASITQANVRVALVAKTPTTIRFCEQYCATSKRLGSNWRFEIFTDRDTARAWLGKR